VDSGAVDQFRRSGTGAQASGAAQSGAQSSSTRTSGDADGATSDQNQSDQNQGTGSSDAQRERSKQGKDPDKGPDATSRGGNASFSGSGDDPNVPNAATMDNSRPEGAEAKSHKKNRKHKKNVSDQQSSSDQSGTHGQHVNTGSQGQKSNQSNNQQ
jgi:hypothetical protein